MGDHLGRRDRDGQVRFGFSCTDGIYRRQLVPMSASFLRRQVGAEAQGQNGQLETLHLLAILEYGDT